MKGVYIDNGFWDAYAEKISNYHHAINCNYENGRISLQEKCKAQSNVDCLFEDFFLESSTIV